MAGYVNLPQFEVPGNALLNFAPVNNALANYGQTQRSLEAEGYQRQRQAVSDGRQAMQFAQQQRDRAEDRIGRMAMNGATLPKGDPRRAMLLQRILSEHPEVDGLRPEYKNPDTAFDLIAAEYGKLSGQGERKTYEVGGRLVEVSPTGQTREIYSAPEKQDPVREMLMRRLGGQQQPRQQEPTVQQQSFTPMEQRGPRLQNVADVAPQQQATAMPQADMVDTPYGRMSKQEAREMGGAMLLDPKYAAAGRAILDTINEPSSGSLTKPAQNAIDEKAIGMVDLAGRLDGIMGKYKPEFQTYETAAKMAVTKGLDSFEATRGSIPPQDAKMLEEYTAFKQDAINNLSEYIKYVTGAAMGVQEEGRIRKGMPDPEKDSPREFAAKLKNSVATTKLALARYTYLKRNGYNDQTIEALSKSDKIGAVQSLDEMQGIINQRLDSEAQMFKQSNPGADDMAIRQHLRKVQKQEFGI